MKGPKKRAVFQTQLSLKSRSKPIDPVERVDDITKLTRALEEDIERMRFYLPLFGAIGMMLFEGIPRDSIRARVKEFILERFIPNFVHESLGEKTLPYLGDIEEFLRDCDYVEEHQDDYDLEDESQQILALAIEICREILDEYDPAEITP